jgi:hypothetical protein
MFDENSYSNAYQDEPPMILILFPKKFPALLPKKKPMNERVNVTVPIIIIGVAM